MESTNSSHIKGQVTFDQLTKSVQWRKVVLTNHATTG